ncbi:MAG: putative MATE family efflux protein [Methanobacteriota archaeon]|jgi:putative MATE family efflux protein|uniref:Multidrug-efflux transporter n=1 Tax=Halorutilus salinus TaxID=2487751 RepID=A0A9Q4C1N6_9EURY|nr:MATE family efflux transporter [Halorutilus salinus]MCX2818280.1 MATE family efflux transporter [Halorutilus salinus]
MSLRDRLGVIFKNRDEFDLTSGSVGKPLFYLSLPIVVTNLLQTAYNLVDTFWLGQYSDDALAAISFAFPVVFLLISLGMGLAVAGSVLVAQHTGANEKEEAEFAASQVTGFSLIASVVLGAGGYFIVEDFLALTGASDTVVRLGASYMEVISLGLVFMFGFFTFIFLMRGYGDTITPMLVMLGSVVLNILLDPFLIFGWGPFPEMGIQGAAVATVFSRSLALGVGLFVMLRTTYGVRIHARDMVPNPTFVRKIVRIGGPASVETTGRAVSINALLFVVGMFGDTVAAAFGVGTRVFSVIFLPAAAVAQGVETMTGQNIGADEPDRVEAANHIAARTMFVVLAAMGVVTWLFANSVIAIFTDNPAIIDEGATFLRFVAPTFGFLGVMRAYIGGIRGTGKTLTAAAITVGVVGLARLGIAYVGATQFGSNGLWLAFAVSNIIGATVAFGWFSTGRWRDMNLTGKTETTKADD